MASCRVAPFGSFPIRASLGRDLRPFRHAPPFLATQLFTLAMPISVDVDAHPRIGNHVAAETRTHPIRR